MMGKEEGMIPFVKPARVGNFKMWRTKVSYDLTADDVKDEEERELVKAGKLKLKKKRVEIDAINISDLEGTWMVRIPSTFMMYNTLTECYHASVTSADRESKAIALGELRTIISNMYYVSCVNNGYYHQGIDMLTAAYANPLLLQGGKEGKEFSKSAKTLVKAFLEWRKLYDERMSQNEPTEEDMERERKASEMEQIVGQNEAPQE